MRLGSRGEELRRLLRRRPPREQPAQLAALLAGDTRGEREQARLRAIVQDPAAEKIQTARGGGEQPVLEEHPLPAGQRADGEADAALDLPGLEQPVGTPPAWPVMALWPATIAGNRRMDAARMQVSARPAGAETAPTGACNPMPTRLIAPPSWLAGDLRRRTGSGSPSIRTSRFACW